jgi:hypothetical protein
MLVMLEAQLQIHMFNVFVLHTHSQIFSTTSKLICIAWKSSKPLPFCIMLWITGKVLQFLIVINTIC